MSGRAPGIPSSREASRLQPQAVDWRPLEPRRVTRDLPSSDHQSDLSAGVEPVSMNTVWCSTAKASPPPTNSTDSSASAQNLVTGWAMHGKGRAQ
jgi:hypothetical protein